MPMTTPVAQAGTPGRLRRYGGGRFLLLIGALGVLIVFCVGRDILGEDGGSTSETAPSYEGTWPSAGVVQYYLERQSQDPDQLRDPAGLAPPFGSEPGRIEALTIRREDSFFTSASFVFRTDKGSYPMEATINHHPSDGMNVFDTVHVMKAAPR